MPKPKIDVHKALLARRAGATYQQIGDAQGVCRDAVRRRLKPLLVLMPDASELNQIKEQTTDLIAMELHKNLVMLHDTDCPKERKDLWVGVGIGNANYRLNTDKSTGNISIADARAWIMRPDPGQPEPDV